MSDQFSENAQRKLPLPKWCFVLLAIPTFFMPVALLLFAGWALGSLILEKPLDFPSWLQMLMAAAVTIYVVLLPIFLLWAISSKRLSWREKLLWIPVFILWLNMAGMPFFYVFMLRRYLGYEDKAHPRDELAAEKLLASCGMKREEIAANQWKVLVRYLRQIRLAKWCIAPTVALAALLLYASIVILPKMALKMMAASPVFPERIVIIDSAKDTRQEIAPDDETQMNIVKIFLMLGAMAGMWAMLSLCFTISFVFQTWGNWHHRAFMQYLQAAHNNIA